MFSGWTRTLHEISIFHHPNSPPSVKALGMLRAAVSSAYPPGGSKPLPFNLEVVEAPPTADQLRTILSFIPSKNNNEEVSAASVFLSAHPASASSTGASVQSIAGMRRDKPNTFKWPVVVDWNAGRASVGDVEGVKGILEHLRQQRDGEASN
ncbi:thioredoxin-like protein [Roridomyces roridus]|uniref:Thioredoxin-like protein n=1 Tax=Roridomyces roridus TaxID=1738132 RepID=A0AAD7G2W9_9AGAR|nr:thioredoxin-like protein [Roridomyces roridus]